MLGHLLGSSSSNDAAAIAATLRLEGYDDPHHLQELQPHLHFRLLLLVQKRPSDFESAELFCDWAERQLGLPYVVRRMREVAAARPDLGGNPLAYDIDAYLQVPRQLSPALSPALPHSCPLAHP